MLQRELGGTSIKELNKKSWPEFIRHGDTPSWNKIYDEFSDFVLMLIDSNEHLIGAGFTIPVSWDEKIENLPAIIESRFSVPVLPAVRALKLENL